MNELHGITAQTAHLQANRGHVKALPNVCPILLVWTLDFLWAVSWLSMCHVTYGDYLAFFFLFAGGCAVRGCGTSIARWRSHLLALSTAAFACAYLPALR